MRIPRQARAIACFPRPIASFPAWVLTAIRMTRHIPRGSTKRSFEVGDITIAEDGETATATATITHMPLISYVEEYMGETDDAGEEQESEPR